MMFYIGITLLIIMAVAVILIATSLMREMIEKSSRVNTQIQQLPNEVRRLRARGTLMILLFGSIGGIVGGGLSVITKNQNFIGFGALSGATIGILTSIFLHFSAGNEK